MNSFGDILRKDELSVMSLRRLYGQYGYKKFKMSKFEEYDLYLENKSFLQSEKIITFNDHNGKLLALKPDITLSIVKNTGSTAEIPRKTYYTENVYRAAKGASEIKEIMQVGIEYIGPVGLYEMSEVVTLAVKSLETVSDDYVMGISHMGFTVELLKETGLSYSHCKELLGHISNKNIHDITATCERYGVDEKLKERLAGLASIYGSFDEALPRAKDLAINSEMKSAISDLEELYRVLKETGNDKNIRLDFSITNDTDYYNGIVFTGYVDRVPCSVLQGGRYDNLMRRLGKKQSAVGFALSLDMIERYYSDEKKYDVDILIINDEDADAAVLLGEIEKYTKSGVSVRVQRDKTDNIRYKKLGYFRNGGVDIVEENA